tara:strand:+ start:98 stop:286 length:189 start_codon:yes stop_codon:yes gene_type:complete
METALSGMERALSGIIAALSGLIKNLSRTGTTPNALAKPLITTVSPVRRVVAESTLRPSVKR